MTDRETFLSRVRERRQHPYHYSLNDPGPDVPKPVLSSVEVSVLGEDLPASDLIEHFTRMLEDVGGHVVRARDAQAAREWLVGFVAERGLERAVVTRDVPVEGLATALTDAGLAVTMPPAGESMGHAAGQSPSLLPTRPGSDPPPLLPLLPLPRIPENLPVRLTRPPRTHPGIHPCRRRRRMTQQILHHRQILRHLPV